MFLLWEKAVFYFLEWRCTWRWALSETILCQPTLMVRFSIVWTVNLMEPLSSRAEQPTQRNCLACFIPWSFEMFRLGQINFGLGQTNIILQTTICKANREADILTTILMIMEIRISNQPCVLLKSNLALIVITFFYSCNHFPTFSHENPLLSPHHQDIIWVSVWIYALAL